MSENASGFDRCDVERADRGVSLAEAIRELAYAVRLLAKHAPRDPDTLLTAEQVSKVFGLSPRSLKDRAAAGALPHRRFGKHYRFSRGDVAEIVRITGCAQQSRGGQAA